MAEQEINVATESSVEEIQTSIGATGNTGGSTTAGTIFGKLNKIIADLANHISSWTSTRAGYIDRLANGTYGLDKIKTDTGNILNKLNSGVSAAPITSPIILKTGEISTTAGNTTSQAVVNITGKGILNYAILSGSVGAYGRYPFTLKITVDGVVKYFLTRKSPSDVSDAPTGVILVADPNSIISSETGPAFLNSSYYTSGFRVGNVCSPSSTEQVYTQGGYPYVYATVGRLYNGLSFNSSLKVEVIHKNTYTSGTPRVYYEIGYILL